MEIAVLTCFTLLTLCWGVFGDEGDKEDGGAEELRGADGAEGGEVAEGADRTDVAAIYIVICGAKNNKWCRCFLGKVQVNQ